MLVMTTIVMTMTALKITQGPGQDSMRAVTGVG